MPEETGKPRVDRTRESYERVREDLVRTAIKQPLLDMVRDPANSSRAIPVLVEVNNEYFLGKENALQAIRELVQDIKNGELQSIGSDQNPYYGASLTPEQILHIVDRDDENAFNKLRAAHEEGTAGGSKHGGAVAPQNVSRYLSIQRIWYNQPISPLIDRSVSTVKADAAHRAFLAEGKGIVWAVIDSGIDSRHDHFAGGNLEVALPIQHCDLTITGGIGSSSALTDKFGHGTHVAGIIAGSYGSNAQGKAMAVRSRLGMGQQIETFNEELTQISGMAPACKLVSLKVLDDTGNGDVSNIIAAIDEIQKVNDYGRNIKIHGVNLSVGYEFDPLWFACGQSPVCVEVDRLVRSGVVVVVAAGNTGYGVLSANQRNTGAGFMLTINDPGNAALAITVGSTHRDEPYTYGVSYFSSKGPTGDGRTKPDVVAPGERILSCYSPGKDSSGSTCTYVEDSGTSMAAPHVSGIIAAFLSIRREYIGKPEKIKELFLSSATDLGRNAYFQGHGLVDLMRAIQSV